MTQLIKKPLYIASTFVLLNLILGRLFHESLNLLCFSELFIIAFTSLAFWLVSLPVIKHITIRWNPKQNLQHFSTQLFLGTIAVFINILISYMAVYVAMVYVYNCTTPSLSLVNLSLTNNVAINFLCYAALVIFYIEKFRNHISSENDDESSENPLSKIALNAKGQQYFISIEDIKYIEASNNCIVINTAQGRFVKYQSLKSFLEDCSSCYLKRVHRSYAVNINHINSIKKNKNGDGLITLTDERIVKLSRNYQMSLAN